MGWHYDFPKLIFAACLTAASIQAQSPEAVPAPPPDLSAPSTNLAFEPIGPGDLLYISVMGAPELTRSYRTGPDGTIALPLLHENIPVSGLSPHAVSDAVASALVHAHVLVQPIVSTSVLDYRSRTISIVGAVRLPITMQAIGHMKLLDAIAHAQGIAPDAGPEIIVSRTEPASGANTVFHIPVKALLAGTDASLNIALQGGEEIRIPEAPKLYVVGNVKVPGTYPLTDLEGSSVLKVLAQSQGVLPYTSSEAYVYRAVPGAKNRQEISIELSKILHRKTPDFNLQANDILYIPDNSRMRLSATVLERLAGFGSSTATGLIVWR